MQRNPRGVSGKKAPYCFCFQQRPSGLRHLVRLKILAEHTECLFNYIQRQPITSQPIKSTMRRSKKPPKSKKNSSRFDACAAVFMKRQVVCSYLLHSLDHWLQPISVNLAVAVQEGQDGGRGRVGSSHTWPDQTWGRTWKEGTWRNLSNILPHSKDISMLSDVWGALVQNVTDTTPNCIHRFFFGKEGALLKVKSTISGPNSIFALTLGSNLWSCTCGTLTPPTIKFILFIWYIIFLIFKW